MSSSSSSVDCLLLAENLRCAPLSLIEIHALTVLPAIELFFCVFLVYMTWGSKRAHLLLAADGVLYFILALVDLLLHVVPAVQNSVTTSRVAELFLGSVSFVPMLSYISYLVWLSCREFIPYLPRRSQGAAKYLFTGLIPVVAVLNFVASLGMSIQNLSFPLLMINLTSKSESLWLGLGQLSLILYTNHQCLTAFLALYRLFTALSNQWRIDTNDADERHFFNGIGWITFGIKLGAVECIVGSLAGGFTVSLCRRFLRLVGRVCMIIGAVKGMDEHQNFEFLSKELASWRRGPLTMSHSFMANKCISIQSQFSDLSRQSYLNEKDVKRGKADRDVTVYDVVDELPVLHIRSFAPCPPEQPIHADESRRQSGQNTSAEVLASPNDTSPLKGNARDQSAQIISDDMKVMLELISDLAPSITGECPETTLGQEHEDDEFKLPDLDQQSTRHNTAQSYDEEDAAAVHTVSCASEFMEHKPILPPISVPQAVYAQEERPVSSCIRVASQHRSSNYPVQLPITPTRAGKPLLSCIRLVSQHRSRNYPVQFPVTPTRARITINSLAAQLKGEKWDSLIGRHTQLLSRHLLERAGRTCSNITARSSLWSQQSASLSMHAKVTSPSHVWAYPGDLVSPPSAETLRDGIIDQELVDAVIQEFDAAVNREKALRRLNGEIGV